MMWLETISKGIGVAARWFGNTRSVGEASGLDVPIIEKGKSTVSFLVPRCGGRAGQPSART
jgi:hypothetical protein